MTGQLKCMDKHENGRDLRGDKNGENDNFDRGGGCKEMLMFPILSHAHYAPLYMVNI